MTRSDELGKAMEDCRQDGIPCTGCRSRFKIKRKLSFDDIYLKKKFRLLFENQLKRKSFGDPKNPSKPSDTEMIYALGTRMGNYRGFRKINHSGSFGGYNSYVYMLPDLKIGAFIAVNGGSDVYNFMRKVIYAAFDMLLGVNQGYL